MKYNFKQVEEFAQKIWREQNIFQTKKISPDKKFYCLDMFPYPSGEGLHIGHIKGYTATDIISRFYKLKGKDVIHPMGWDAFGLPAENYAIKMGVNPKIITQKNISNFKKQLQDLGFSYDWSREINTTDPDYYRWTQWIFLKLFEKGLAYEDEVPINFCPSCKTGLANEEAVNGICDRCGSKVTRKKIRQWILKITAYADRLLEDLNELDWPEPIKEMQKNWIGKSQGTTIKFKLEDSDDEIEVFTTRADTLFGCTWVALAPEHKLVAKITTAEQRIEVETYQTATQNKSDMDRIEQKEKTGVFTGAYAINPINGKRVPVWIADYVLAGYGTGAVMAVPAHDERDWEFAKYNRLPIKFVIKPKSISSFRLFHEYNELLHQQVRGDVFVYRKDRETPGQAFERIQQEIEDNTYDSPFINPGVLIDSGEYNDLSSEEAKQLITEELLKLGKGSFTTSYKLRDWIFSRQRYWGEPIPLVHCEKCGVVAVSEKDLPVKLPDLEKYEPSGNGESPLVNAKEWLNTTCPKCAGPATRETNTMPQWAGSCWYYLRYLSPQYDQGVIEGEAEKAAMPVDLYVGGAEHAVLHLLYARFWHKFLFDINVVSTKEPFKKLRNVGLIMGSDGQKMSKSKGNIINPNNISNSFGSDALRMYTMFLGPFEQTASWNENGIKGVYKLLSGLFEDVVSERVSEESKSSKLAKLAESFHRKIEKMQFNTLVSDLMIFYNSGEAKNLSTEELKSFLIIISPIAPHFSEFLWGNLGFEKTIFEQRWPELKKQKELENYKIIVQVNGKKRAEIETDNKLKDFVEAKALAKVQDYIQQNNLSIKNIIYIEGKLLNIVAK